MKKFLEEHWLFLGIVGVLLFALYQAGQVANDATNTVNQSEKNALQLEEDLNPFYWISAAYAKITGTSQ